MIHQDCQLVFLLAAIAIIAITFLSAYCQFLLYKLHKAYINEDFGCHNKAGGKEMGSKLIKKERRRIKSGEIVLVVCDIKGMGSLNQAIGEVSVNQKIKESLNKIKKWRGILFTSQVNSGDEFAFLVERFSFYVDKVDVEGIVPRINRVFIEQGFNGIYGAIAPITSSDYIVAAQQGMDLVYEQKLKSKI